MNEDLSRLRRLFDKAPFWLVIPFAAVLFYGSALLYLCFLPLIIVYSYLLRAIVWIEWEEQGKDVLLVHMGSEHSTQWMTRLLPMIGNRAVVLNYSEEKHWDGWSLAAQLFRVFGPTAPGALPEYSLPIVIVFHHLDSPQRFFFGKRSKDCEEKLERLGRLLM